MPSLSEITAYQRGVVDVATLSIADLVAFWGSLDVADAPAAAGAVRQFIPDLLDSYTPLAAELGATFYDESRDAAQAAGRFAASHGPGPLLERVDSLIGWGSAPLFQVRSGGDLAEALPAPDADLALSRLTGGTQRLVANAARETVVHNVERDPAQPRWARHASANACAFCALLATRGAAYRSQDAAGGHYHNACHCVAVPSWGGDYEPAPYVREWDSAYRAARKSGVTDTKGVLADMRVTLGAS